MSIEQLMSRDVSYCRPDETLASAARSMWDHDCGCLPVCTGDGTPRLVGMITDRDICMSALFEGKPLGDLLVSNAMSRMVLSCRPTDQPGRVERLMRERQIRRVPVTDGSGNLLGIVSLADLARAARGLRGTEIADIGITGTEIGDTLAAICAPPAPIAH